MIKVVNIYSLTNPRRSEFDIYIGRPNVLGNPYSHMANSKYQIIKVDTRERAVELYDKWLSNQLSGKGDVYNAIHDLVDIYNKHGRLNLICWCAPELCHGDVIKQRIMELIKPNE